MTLWVEFCGMRKDVDTLFTFYTHELRNERGGSPEQCLLSEGRADLDAVILRVGRNRGIWSEKRP
jgi:hypothetical protein